jgi:hypothetical protein
LKTHKYGDIESISEKKDALFIVPIRNPLDACVSISRIATRPISDMEAWCKTAMKSQLEHLKYAEKLKSKGCHVLIVKYEDFENNIDFLLRFIEQNLNLRIAHFDKETIKRGYSKENISASINSLPDFEQFLPLSGFHGKHVALETYHTPDEVLRSLTDFLPQIAPAFQKYGYFTEEKL